MTLLLDPITVEQMRIFERRLIQDFKIPEAWLMENAAHAVADQARVFLHQRGKKHIKVVAGWGHNGADAVAAARQLLDRGTVDVQIYSVSSGRAVRPLLKKQLAIAKRIGACVTQVCEKDVQTVDMQADLIIDGLFGIGLNSPIRDAAVITLISKVVASKVPVISVDVPSGLDADTGIICGAAVRAEQTVTFCRSKKGFFLNDGPSHTGTITVADIGVPFFLE